MLSSTDLSNRYFTWLQKSISFEQLNQTTTRIDVPFLDSFSDELVIYAIQKDNGQLILTDDGWTLDNLAGEAVFIAHPSKEKTQLHQRLRAYGIVCEDNELKITTTLETFAQRMHLLLQTIVFVNDWATLSRSTSTKTTTD
ncbi:hypothetical protein AYR62_05515 [Secundilactobacillus paracollinoides]|uniref:DUF1828 domain-containing protein n=1 Tax=Secundilactobacillus paracollinoides TaxID=240427 RepID=A0A1B2J0J4_9LACO|nr:DUF1828 domain-containing protein [Secundilactobacillus paracollinoides]ANZ63604.1 hypothetical protein AYR62_05515 [Secundilactobacillus paracollinoides]ANZ67864.1 hypothetical protein AYR63_12425 [Secundilactobacillus paracollinoides]KRL79272.1 hypothetical protein FC17_GL000537 [Secundilactobacillus paracollinoides DSM 15502 = JCM 11969]